MADIGSYESSNDSGVLNHTTFFKHLKRKNLDVPPSKQLFNDTKGSCLPHILLGDEAFPLRCDSMQPYARNALTNETCILNYRLSRARRVVKYEFGILANSWRILSSPHLFKSQQCHYSSQGDHCTPLYPYAAK